MRYTLLIISVLLIFMGCSKDKEQLNNNPFLVRPIVSLNLNLNLPEYNGLNFPGSSVIITQQGIRGVVVYCVNENFYTAFELSDPNHIPNNCSRMTVEGIIATCPCPDDDNKYDIVTGQPSPSDPNKYPMMQYRAERVGSNIQVSN